MLPVLSSATAALVPPPPAALATISAIVASAPPPLAVTAARARVALTPRVASISFLTLLAFHVATLPLLIPLEVTVPLSVSAPSAIGIPLAVSVILPISSPRPRPVAPSHADCQRVLLLRQVETDEALSFYKLPRLLRTLSEEDDLPSFTTHQPPTSERARRAL